MLIKSLHLKNILSFKDAELELQPLNVLIGPNGSGKSNLIDVIGLLQAVPNDIAGFLRSNGPTGDWAWKGPGREETPFQITRIEAEFGTSLPRIYKLGMSLQDDRVHSLTERLDLIETEQDKTVYSRPFFQATNGSARLWPTRTDGTLADYGDELVQVDIPRGKSVLSEIRSPADYPATTETARLMSTIKVYRSWEVGRHSPVRRSQRTDGDPSFVEEDFSNLALVVNDLRENHGLGPSMDSYLERFYESYQSLHTPVHDSMIRLTARESSLSRPIPASRLSDGTIRFIALLAILCHPEPPPLICIEEPEIAMHPDSLGLIAELLRKAAERTQIIVTTHSPELVSLLPPEPEAEFVVVCERDAAEGTHFHRPSYKELREWQDIYQQTGKELVVYGLSEMWMSGALGGVR